MHVLITSPRGKNLEYDVTAVSGRNARGEFSILPNHTHFLTIITGEVMLYPEALFDEKPQPITVDVGTGVLRCLGDNVEIYRHLVTIDELASQLTSTKPNLGSKPPSSESSPVRK